MTKWGERGIEPLHNSGLGPIFPFTFNNMEGGDPMSHCLKPAAAQVQASARPGIIAG
jgi:hypothetical protein